ncbi:MAG TPA: class I SAM-dependent methyltransferase [Gemmatimonadaceae bacterium]|nr:class I SAM-dependent methyltransferase [Gemmatimonadaceae bacterium]
MPIVPPIDPGRHVRIEQLQNQWERFGASDPLRAVLADTKDEAVLNDPAEFFALGRADVDRWLARLGQLRGTLPAERALDFGCGAGRLTQALARHYRQVVGVDVSRPMLDAARRHNEFGERVTFVHNPSADLRILGDDRFDLVLTHIVLQHLSPVLITGYLSELLRIVAPGGSMVFQLPVERTGRRGRYAVIQRLSWLIRAYRRLRHGPAPHMEMHAVSEEKVAELIARGGGKILAADRDDSAGPAFESRIFYVVKES